MMGKTVFLILSILCISLFVTLYPQATEEVFFAEDKQYDELIDDYPFKTINDPIVIVIDPGHSTQFNYEQEPIAPGSDITKRKYGVGTAGNITGVMERDIVLNVSFILKDLLKDHEYIVYMTRDDHLDMLGNIERVNIANYLNADLMIRVHCDSSIYKSNDGASILYPAPIYYAVDIAQTSQEYGEIILDTLIDEIGMDRFGSFERDDQTGFNFSKIPNIVVEMGFLSNPAEEQLLIQESYQLRLAHALFKGIENIFHPKENLS